MIQKKCKTSLFTALIILMFGIFSFGGAFAQETTDVPKGPAPSTNATEIEGPVPAFQEPPAVEEPMLRPNHPPMDKIPPMPMPEQPKDEGLPPASMGPGAIVTYNAETKESTEVTALAADGLVLRDGYSGAYGDAGTEMVPAGFGTMSQIANTQDHPWRMNVKLVIRMGTSWYNCSGSMIDAETVLTAGHCVYDYGGYGWANEIWVYPGWDGVGNEWSAPNSIVNPYGYGHSTFFGTTNAWLTSGDHNGDVGTIAITRSVGTITGWFGLAGGGTCAQRLAQSWNNASYPGEYCASGLHTGREMYYWYGPFDWCGDTYNWLRLYTTPGCFTAVWGGMSGSGAYYIDGSNRYIHAVCTTSDRAYNADYTRQYQWWVDWLNNTFIPSYARGSVFDLQALDVNAAPATIPAGTSTTLLNHLAVNPTNGASASSGPWTFRVYLSADDNISAADTLLSTQFYSWSFGAMGSVTVNMAQVTIPANTPVGNYWLGLIYDCATDGNCANNETDGWDAVPIQVIATYALTVSKTGTGSGTVTSSPAGINCGTDCTELYNSGTVVTLTAAAATGSSFAGWSGACTGTGTCTVTMNAAKSVTATFNLNQYTLTVSKAGTGSGTVTSSPAGINCGTDCTEPYNYNTVVTLTAAAATGSSFAGWSGACTGTGTCTVTMNAAKSVTATFNLNQYTLTVSKAGTGSGTVTSSPAGINCGADCTEPYNYNTVVTLTAAAATGSSFAGWSGACTGTGTCTVTMNAAKSVTATFNLTLPNVSVILVPDSTSIPRGGTLGYTVKATNNTSTSQTFQYWTYVILPNGSRYPVTGELFGPVTVTLSPGQVRSAHLTHGIPTSAPLGTYTYYGQVGPYPTIWDSDSFNFTVTSTLAPQGETRKGWELLENGLTK